VIVSFTDAGEEDPVGIYLFEPGADPVELSAAGVSGVATEFEYATVEASTLDGKQDFEFPGDGMVTRAQRDSDVEAATQEHATLVDNHEKLTAQTRSLLDTVRREHDEYHVDPFEFCALSVCAAARAVDL